MNKTLFAAALAALLAMPAQAVTFEGAVTQGTTTVVDYSGLRLLSFDIDFGNTAPAVLSFRIDAEDVAGGLPVTLNAMLRNFTGLGVPAYAFTLGSGGFGTIGTVTRPFGGTTDIAVNGPTATFTFSTPEFLDVEVGNALGTTAGTTDWTLTGFQAGDRLDLRVSVVPEPGTLALLLAGLGVVGFIARRQQRQA